MTLTHNKLETIKRIRAEKNCSLKEAIDIYHSYNLNPNPNLLAQIESIQNIEDVKAVLTLLVTKYL